MKCFRDILLFPKFNNMDIIEKILKDSDELYGIIQPHITIVFPFIDEIRKHSDQNTWYKANKSTKQYPFYPKHIGCQYR